MGELYNRIFVDKDNGISSMSQRDRDVTKAFSLVSHGILRLKGYIITKDEFQDFEFWFNTLKNQVSKE